MTNIEALRTMTAEQVAALLYASRTNIFGWAYPELIDWLKADDNVSSKVNDDLINYCWSCTYGSVRISKSVDGKAGR